MSERERFEKWCDVHNCSFDYWQFSINSPIGEHCWKAWCAALEGATPLTDERLVGYACERELEDVQKDGERSCLLSTRPYRGCNTPLYTR